MNHGADEFELEPFYLKGAGGPVFSLSCRPRRPPARAVLFCPPFAEEMNKCRRMCALAAHALARSGHTALIIDLFGTGDSGGDFSDGRWELWKEDLCIALDWLSRDVGTVSLLGIRLGAILAAECARSSGSRIDELVFWQPVVSGETHMTQFLRLKVAAQMAQGGEKISTSDLRQRSAAGEPVEVAGYSLAPGLVSAIDSVDLRKQEFPAGLPVHWIEQVTSTRPEPNLLSRKLIDHWRGEGRTVTLDTVGGEPFWATPEVTLAPDFIAKTIDRRAAHN